ncbi:nuclear transport factor 2 family protein [Microbacterium sp. ARD31]|uniref:nuclear transport factor 2 family protein n=1 Tax=Microbacterium sp. ARD31 TaxID=2962576 RepID=UPI002881E6C4|nr:nuclear transport factor 2 family protein [Microbacterium sp. ARD31]MDT0184003.1 nuclear transport factor 2 family protein [Microbacterium sp. ARD31]
MSAPAAPVADEGRIRRLVERVNAGKGDNGALREVMSPDVVLHAEGISPLGGTHRGLDQALSRFPILFDLSGGTLVLEPLEFVVDDHFALFLQRATATRGSARLDHVITVIWRFRGGQVVEMWDHFADVDEWDRFWTEAPR